MHMDEKSPVSRRESVNFCRHKFLNYINYLLSNKNFTVCPKMSIEWRKKRKRIKKNERE